MKSALNAFRPAAWGVCTGIAWQGVRSLLQGAQKLDTLAGLLERSHERSQIVSHL